MSRHMTDGLVMISLTGLDTAVCRWVAVKSILSMCTECILEENSLCMQQSKAGATDVSAVEREARESEWRTRVMLHVRRSASACTWPSLPEEICIVVYKTRRTHHGCPEGIDATAANKCAQFERRDPSSARAIWTLAWRGLSRPTCPSFVPMVRLLIAVGNPPREPSP